MCLYFVKRKLFQRGLRAILTWCLSSVLIFVAIVDLSFVTIKRDYASNHAIQENDTSLRYENPPMLTKLLYKSGHDIHPRNVCLDNGLDLFLLIIITSSPKNFHQRQAIRSTWMSIAESDDVDAAFFVGQSLNAEDNVLVEKENGTYGDIIRGNFIDTYNNLTLKTMSMLEWTLRRCNETRFLLKADDDVFINPQILLTILDQRKNQRNAIIGKVARHWKLNRKKTSKYYIPSAQYKNAMYPTFNTGPAYVLTNDTVASLYTASLNEVFFKLEDVFITGIVARKLKITHINYVQFHNSGIDGLNKCVVSWLATIHDVGPKEMISFWDVITGNICPYKEGNEDD